MEFGIEKCAMLIMERGKREMMQRLELPNKESLRILGEKEKLQELGNIGNGHHDTNRNLKKNGIHQKKKKLLLTKVCC